MCDVMDAAAVSRFPGQVFCHAGQLSCWAISPKRTPALAPRGLPQHVYGLAVPERNVDAAAVCNTRQQPIGLLHLLHLGELDDGGVGDLWAGTDAEDSKERAAGGELGHASVGHEHAPRQQQLHTHTISATGGASLQQSSLACVCFEAPPAATCQAACICTDKEKAPASTWSHRHEAGEGSSIDMEEPSKEEPWRSLVSMSIDMEEPCLCLCSSIDFS
jgi:hypothetical protein